MTLETDLKQCIKAMKSGYYTTKDAERIKAVMERALAWITGEGSEIVRCKDCKHFPEGDDRDDLEWPDEVCPCQCEDYWYSYKPKEDFYCGHGERK